MYEFSTFQKDSKVKNYTQYSISHIQGHCLNHCYYVVTKALFCILHAFSFAFKKNYFIYHQFTKS